MRTKPEPPRRDRLRNWREYNAALVQRGSLTLWCDAEAVAGWVTQERTGRRGRPCVYSAAAITCLLTLQQVFHLPLRAVVGFARSLLGLLGHAALPVAHPATLSRRRRTLAVPLPLRRPAGPLHLVVDSTGLKVYGEGEWKVRQHGWAKRRTWVKVHLAVDAATHELRVVHVTPPAAEDSRQLPALLADEPAPLAQVTADGAYDSQRCYAAVAARPEQPRAVFPPRRERRAGRPVRPRRNGYARSTPPRAYRTRQYTLHVWQHGNCHAPPLARDEHVRAIRRMGRRAWKRAVGYHRRSLVETAVWRLKQLFGPGVAARSLAAQTTIVRLRVAALNRMTALGMPAYAPRAP